MDWYGLVGMGLGGYMEITIAGMGWDVSGEHWNAMHGNDIARACSSHPFFPSSILSCPVLFQVSLLPIRPSVNRQGTKQRASQTSQWVSYLVDMVPSLDFPLSYYFEFSACKISIRPGARAMMMAPHLHYLPSILLSPARRRRRAAECASPLFLA
ncbi:hypothetical protein BCR34DRAFT_153552 [Clohesyomyces aquaticus]|uniref:Uncharacterized protein n=1 Tax=Clohesyomyces aquaticus TaxID=1231657 RepID=A0A1Y1ZZZ3_9PLEO|nr:hypothetical protein BCR34DRAFT_153552 [Clohesyomyces aquaticus]